MHPMGFDPQCRSQRMQRGPDPEQALGVTMAASNCFWWTHFGAGKSICWQRRRDSQIANGFEYQELHSWNQLLRTRETWLFVVQFVCFHLGDGSGRSNQKRWWLGFCCDQHRFFHVIFQACITQENQFVQQCVMIS